MPEKWGKKKKEIKLRKALLEQEDYLIKRLREEWEEAESAMRKEELKRRSKDAAIFIAKTILVLLAVGGALTIAAVAPNILALFGRMKKSHRRFYEKDRFREATASLSRRGFIRQAKSKEGTILTLTDRGKKKVINLSYQNLRPRNRDKWDGYWRVVIYDIPLKNKWSREGFRDKLKLMGFYPLQKSVFVSPYPCNEELDFLCGIYNIAGNVRLIDTKTIGNDEVLKKHFGLK